MVRVSEVFFFSHTCCFLSVRKSVIPLQMESWNVELVKLVLEEIWEDGVEHRVEVYKQDRMCPC